MRKVRVYEKHPHYLYMPKDFVEEGFVGVMDALANAKTITLLHPSTTLEEAEKSLEIVIEDIRLRRGMYKNKGEENGKDISG